MQSRKQIPNFKHEKRNLVHTGAPYGFKLSILIKFNGGLINLTKIIEESINSLSDIKSNLFQLGSHKTELGYS